MYFDASEYTANFAHNGDSRRRSSACGGIANTLTRRTRRDPEPGISQPSNAGHCNALAFRIRLSSNLNRSMATVAFIEPRGKKEFNNSVSCDSWYTFSNKPDPLIFYNLHTRILRSLQLFDCCGSPGGCSTCAYVVCCHCCAGNVMNVGIPDWRCYPNCHHPLPNVTAGTIGDAAGRSYCLSCILSLTPLFPLWLGGFKLDVRSATMACLHSCASYCSV